MRAVSSHTCTHQLATWCQSRWPPGAIYKNEDWRPKFPRRCTHCLELTIPLHLHNATISERQFKSALKTHLFNLEYNWQLLSENYWRVNLLTYLCSQQTQTSSSEISILWYHAIVSPVYVIHCPFMHSLLLISIRLQTLIRLALRCRVSSWYTH